MLNNAHCREKEAKTENTKVEENEEKRTKRKKNEQNQQIILKGEIGKNKPNLFLMKNITRFTI